MAPTLVEPLWQSCNRPVTALFISPPLLALQQWLPSKLDSSLPSHLNLNSVLFLMRSIILVAPSAARYLTWRQYRLKAFITSNLNSIYIWVVILLAWISLQILSANRRNRGQMQKELVRKCRNFALLSREMLPCNLYTKLKCRSQKMPDALMVTKMRLDLQVCPLRFHWHTKSILYYH